MVTLLAAPTTERVQKMLQNGAVTAAEQMEKEKTETLSPPAQ